MTAPPEGWPRGEGEENAGALNGGAGLASDLPAPEAL
jgi:hypothetical protein